MKRRATFQPPRETPAELVADLLGIVRRQFYPDSLTNNPRAQKRWFQDEHSIRRWCILWPAAWLDERGVWLRPDRYRAALLAVFDDVKRHGNTGEVKCWPRYLASCVQSRFKVRADEFLNEGKAAREAIERVVLGLGKSPAADHARGGADLVRSLSLAHAALARRPRTSREKSSKQLALL